MILLLKFSMVSFTSHLMTLINSHNYACNQGACSLRLVTLQVPIKGREDRRQGAPEKVKGELVSV